MRHFVLSNTNAKRSYKKKSSINLYFFTESFLLQNVCWFRYYADGWHICQNPSCVLYFQVNWDVTSNDLQALPLQLFSGEADLSVKISSKLSLGSDILLYSKVWPRWQYLKPQKDFVAGFWQKTCVEALEGKLTDDSGSVGRWRPVASHLNTKFSTSILLHHSTFLGLWFTIAGHRWQFDWVQNICFLIFMCQRNSSFVYLQLRPS